MRRASLADIVKELGAGRSYLVTSHVHPDGDAIGSMLAMADLLRTMGKERVVCVNDDPVPRIYQWLPGAGDIANSAAAVVGSVDVVVIVDAARKDRLGKAADLIPPHARVVVVDHHLEEQPDGDAVFIDPEYSAVGEILVDLYEIAGVPFSLDAAVCAYVSIITDTGGFRFANTTPRTHRGAAALIASGIDVADVSSRVFDVISGPKCELLRLALERMERDAQGRLAHTTIRAADMTAAGASHEDVDGLVNYPRSLEGVEVGILFREIDPGTTKVSMRSRDTFNCARFLKQWNGGGHAAAAGVTVSMPLEATRAAILGGLRGLLERES